MMLAIKCCANQGSQCLPGELPLNEKVFRGSSPSPSRWCYFSCQKTRRRRSRKSVPVLRLPRLVCFANKAMAAPDDYAIREADTFTKYSGYIATAATSEAEQLLEYDAKQIAAIFTRRPFLLSRRILQIFSTLGVWAFLRYLDSLLGRSESMFKKRAGDLRGALVLLGPAFVKIAQAVSSRPDVIPPAYLEELSLLQDRIAPFSTDAALETIEQDLGLPVDLIFSEISPQPIAAASLGQVYQARLRANGQTVAVKVQRPGVRAAIALDIFILRLLAGLARKAGKLNTDLQAIVDEWATSLFREMDYESEARNGLRFRKTFGLLPDVVVPEMYTELSSRRVLVMEWIEGQRLADVKDLHLIEVGVYCSLTQLLDYGYYHADPHPGNLLRTSDGKLAYLDFGMMGEMQQNIRDSLIEACVHLVNRNYEALAGDFVTLGLVPPEAQMSDVSKALTGVFQDAVSKGVRNISFGDLSENLGRTMYQFKFRIPSYFSLVVRSLTVLEGIALSSNPKYKVLSSSYPWIARKVLTDSSPQLRSTLKALLYKDGVFQVDQLESLVTESLRSATSDSVGDEEEKSSSNTNAIMKKILSFVLSEEGDFVRETLLEEFAKGLDAWNRATFESTTNLIFSNVSPLRTFGYSTLVEEEDVKNLATLNRLTAIVMAGLGSSSDLGKFEEILPSNGVDGTKTPSLEDISSIVQGTVQSLPNAGVLLELPLSEQWQALLLPGELFGRLTSRVVARTIRSSVSRAAENLRMVADETRQP